MATKSVGVTLLFRREAAAFTFLPSGVMKSLSIHALKTGYHLRYVIRQCQCLGHMPSIHFVSYWIHLYCAPVTEPVSEDGEVSALRLINMLTDTREFISAVCARSKVLSPFAL